MQVGDRVDSAVRMARSMRLGSCWGTVRVSMYWWHTSLNRLARSTSCW